MSALLSQAPTQPAAKIPQAARIPSLDGWRGIAILMVLIGHYSIALDPSGRAWISRIGVHGVAIFFALSGFLITTLLMREKEASGRIDLRHFYLRRLFRIMPCAWCYLAVIATVATAARVRLLHGSEVAGCLFFFRNYIDMGDRLITQHYWSLSIEEQFYLLWPCLLLLLGSRRALWFAIAAAVAIATWRWAHWAALSQDSFIASAATQYRADALLAGCAAALAGPAMNRFLRQWMTLPLLAGIAACLIRNPNLIPLTESAMIALLLAVTSQCDSPLSRVLDWRPLTFLGAISYSVYLWQQLCWLIAGHSPRGVTVSLTALALLSAASYFLLEKPMIRLGHRMYPASHIGRQSDAAQEPSTTR